IFISLFPRLTLLFNFGLSGGLLYWLSWVFAPRLLVAVLATIYYWHQNPILVVLSWLIALSGESSEKYTVVKRTYHKQRPSPEFEAPIDPGKKGFDNAKWV